MTTVHAVYGTPPPDLAAPPQGAVQVSPLRPGSAALEEMPDGSLEGVTMLAPPGAVERRYVLAQALRALRPGAELLALAPKDKGGSRLRKELEAFGCTVEEDARRHHRLCRTLRPQAPQGLDLALAEGAPRRVEALDAWSQPGVFSWDRLDPGSALLLQHLPALAGQGADLGCGVGALARAVLAWPAVTRLHMIDIDRRAIDCARRNIEDPRAEFAWADGRALALSGLDFVVCNPPFHDAGEQDHGLGQAFVRAAAAMLRRGGVLRLVANRHLPYEAALREAFAAVRPLADAHGYKVLEARR